MKVFIVGAGSIGNHLANAFRQIDWEVTIFDIDQEALDRTKNQTYPDRYGTWDETIKLSNVFPSGDSFDCALIGTPPDTHFQIMENILNELTIKILVVEKPLFPPKTPDFEKIKLLAESKKIRVIVGFNHNLTPNTVFASEILDNKGIGDIKSIHVDWRESWDGIFAAHPWLEGPHASYLGYSSRGGGSSSEHSHAIAIYLYFIELLQLGNPIKLSSHIVMNTDNDCEYDESMRIFITTDKSFHATICQDVTTSPATKSVRIKGTEGYLEWHVNFDSQNDAVIYKKTNENLKTKLFPKTRPDDFLPEVNHINQLINYPEMNSPTDLKIGIESMKIVEAAFKSFEKKSEVEI